jgi:hypothetical protein
MPDLITHTISAYLIRKRSISRGDLAIYLFGAMLPDLTTRPFMITFPELRYFFHAFHTPIALILIIYLIGQFFEDKIKNRVIKLLSYGTITHLVLDLFQAGVGDRGYGWLFPISYLDFRVNLFWPEDSISILPITISVFAIETFYTYRTKAKKK